MSETLPPLPPPAGVPEPEGDPAVATEPSFGDRLADSSLLRLAVLLGALGYLAYVNLWMFTIVMALVVFIFLHELGHYLVARRNGMKVTEFFIGFGPRIWSFRRGETEYGVKLIWVGAYVKIIGMSNLEEVAPEDEPHTYRAQSFGKRMPVVLAGPAMNLAIGFVLLLVVVAGFGKPSATKFDVSSVTVGSAAEAAGLQKGDRITAFDGQEITDFDSLRGFARDSAGTTAELTVVRDGQEIAVPVTIGWSLTAASAAELGLQEGDRVTQVGDASVSTYPELVTAVKAVDGPTALTYVRGRNTLAHEIPGSITLPQDGDKGFLGVGPGTVYERVPLVSAVPEAASTFGDVVVGSVNGMGRLFSPSGLGNLFSQVANVNDKAPDASTPPAGGSSSTSSGTTSSSSAAVSSDEERPVSVVGIVNLGSQIGEEIGWVGVLFILALVNIFLGLINLVPLLPLDGGHVAVACYEEIRTRISHRPYRVDMAKLMPVTYVVVLLIAGIGLSTIFLDIVKPMNLN